MTAHILEAIKPLRVLVVGDICLDRWCTYDPVVSEPSRETGIPRLGVVATEVTPGGGGTVANNLAALGVSRVAVLGAIGLDGFAEELLGALKERGVAPHLLVKTEQFQTFTYTKLLNAQTGAEDQPRLDFINTRRLPPRAEERVLIRLAEAVPDFDVVIVADQAETGAGGVVTGAVRSALADLAARYPEKIFWVDSRERCDEFRNMILKPNEREAREACSRAFGEVDYRKLREYARAPFLVITHGPAGVVLVEPDAEIAVPARPIDRPVDICGAGDSFSAGAAIALAATGSRLEAARFGNLVASITIMKRGTGTATPEEVLAAASAATS